MDGFLHGMLGGLGASIFWIVFYLRQCATTRKALETANAESTRAAGLAVSYNDARASLERTTGERDAARAQLATLKSQQRQILGDRDKRVTHEGGKPGTTARGTILLSYEHNGKSLYLVAPENAHLQPYSITRGQCTVSEAPAATVA